MENTGLIADFASETNQPLTARSIRQPTSNNPHLPEPVSEPESGIDGAGLEGTGLDGAGLVGGGLGGVEGTAGEGVTCGAGLLTVVLDGAGAPDPPLEVGMGVGVGAWVGAAAAMTNAVVGSACACGACPATAVKAARQGAPPTAMAGAPARRRRESMGLIRRRVV